jgi:esterase/lipase superfamily enzyme
MDDLSTIAGIQRKLVHNASLIRGSKPAYIRGRARRKLARGKVRRSRVRQPKWKQLSRSTQWAGPGLNEIIGDSEIRSIPSSRVKGGSTGESYRDDRRPGSSRLRYSSKKKKGGSTSIAVRPPGPTAPKKAAAPEPLRASSVPRVRQDQAVYLVWYGTNRKPIDPNDVSQGYSGHRDQKIRLGTCQVFIPKSHKIGSIGSSFLRRWWTGVDDSLELLSINEIAAAEYWGKISAHLNSLAIDERDALVFVHGYNCSFEAAALRAAQIGFDLSLKGSMAFFSWPSKGRLLRYAADEASIEASEASITDFISNFALRSGAARVHILAHSMGNRGVLRAVNRIARRARRRTGKPFSQIILAAADVDVDIFRDLCAAYTRVARRTTLYVSKGDLAVEASRWLHRFHRAGLMPPIMIAKGIDTINVTNADLTRLGHGYVAEARDVLQDMHRLLQKGDSPASRFGLREAKTEDGERYWVIGR